MEPSLHAHVCEEAARTLNIFEHVFFGKPSGRAIYFFHLGAPNRPPPTVLKLMLPWPLPRRKAVAVVAVAGAATGRVGATKALPATAAARAALDI